nr:hypothetical protein [Cytophagales bacterium]
MYAHLLPANSPFPASQIQDAATLMYYWGDFAELILLVGLFLHWYQKGGFSSSTQVLATVKKGDRVVKAKGKSVDVEGG